MKRMRMPVGGLIKINIYKETYIHLKRGQKL